jgi:hypothetical protein
MMSKGQSNIEKQNQECEVNGKNPEAPADVEIFKVSRPAFGIEQNSGYEEPGKHKEQIDARPPESDDFAENSRLEVGNSEVEYQNGENCDPANSV